MDKDSSDGDIYGNVFGDMKMTTDTVASHSIFSSLALEGESINPFADVTPWADGQVGSGMPSANFGHISAASFGRAASGSNDNDKNIDGQGADIWGEATEPARAYESVLAVSAERLTLGDTYRGAADQFTDGNRRQSVGNVSLGPDDNDEFVPIVVPSRKRQPPRRHILSQRTKDAMETTAKKFGVGFVDPLTSAAKEAEEQAGPGPLPSAIPANPSLIDEESERKTPSRAKPARGISVARRRANSGGAEHKQTQSAVNPKPNARSKSPDDEGSMPGFDIVVSDPIKVNDTLKSHTVYKVITRVNPAGVLKDPETVVRRRYRDFEWLYFNLTFNHPGVIVPPIPEKQTIGRFDEQFIEQRRLGLQSCLRRVTSHPLLYDDPDLVLFLESQSFETDSRHVSEEKRVKHGSSYIRHNPTSTSSGGGGSGGGGGGGGVVGLGLATLISDAFGKSSKEKNSWVQDKLCEVDAFESQLRQLLRALESMSKQRRELAIGYLELGQSLFHVAENEVNQDLAKTLTNMGCLQQRLKVLQDKQCDKELVTFLLMVDEYIRLAQSIKIAFATRNRVHSRWKATQSELEKKRKQLDQLSRTSRSQAPERVSALRTEITVIEGQAECEGRVFDDIDKRLHRELDRFDRIRAQDVKRTIEEFLEGMIETQEDVVALWENYLTGMQQHGLPYGAEGDPHDRSNDMAIAASLLAAANSSASDGDIRIRPPLGGDNDYDNDKVEGPKTVSAVRDNNGDNDSIHQADAATTTASTAVEHAINNPWT
ncbi:Vacuolar protein sorting-associated protein vps5 [Spiromyces aspiralis]|uniref:Vacuolar protein sorting-associated protein vps5 n=1 Tax=Spiromyces aspiralis TaxID=68401 RepID=A0ACC1HLA4_9FUNG|nr:Vacuolar protein sorting-associated protein vps5 [Spiromyces aspiralis]